MSIFLIADRNLRPAGSQSTIGDYEINNSFSPDPAPCRERLRPARQRCAFRVSPTSPCPHGFHPAQCGKACGNSCRPPGAHRTAVAARVAPPPKCTGNCCQSLRSTSLGLSLKKSSLKSSNAEHSYKSLCSAEHDQLSGLSAHSFISGFRHHSGVFKMIPRNLRACRGRKGTKGRQDRGYTIAHIRQPLTVRQVHDFLILGGQGGFGPRQTLR